MGIKIQTLLPTGCALLGGALYAFSNVGFGCWPLVFICLIPLWFALDKCQQGPVKTSALLGFLFGLSVFAMGYPWLLTLTGEFIDGGLILGILLWCGIGIWFALGFSIYAVMYRALRKTNLPQVVAGTTPLILLEWQQVNLFPSYAGAALISNPILVQIADLGGPLLLSAFVALLNCCIYSIGSAIAPRLRIRFWQKRKPNNSSTTQTPPRPSNRPVNAIVSTVLLISSTVLYGYFQLEKYQYDENSGKPASKSDALNIGVVQTNLVMLSKQELSLRSHSTHLNQSRELLAQDPVDLLIWPETAYVRGLRRPLPIDAQFIRAEIEAPLLFGGTSVWQQDGQRVSANSVFLSNKEGVIDQVYDKNQLIPFAEYLPKIKDIPFFSTLNNILGNELVEKYATLSKKLFPNYQEFRPGEHSNALQLDDISIGTPICYEVIHPDYIREMVNTSRPELIVTLANDAWFGDTQEPWIHLSLARLRAIEHRLWVVRATNSGISAIIDPSGNITARTGLHTKENLRATVYPKTSYTVYAHYGNWVGWLALLLILFLTLPSLLFTLPLRLQRFSRWLSPFFTNS